MRSPEVLLVNDLDRTLLDTSKAYSLFVATCEQTGMTQEGEMEVVRRKTEATGGSFSPLNYLGECGVVGARLDDLLNMYVKNGETEDLVYPDARRYLDMLDTTGQPSVILTYGDNVWQKTKLRAAGLTGLPYIITDESHKGHIISGWRRNAGYKVRVGLLDLSAETAFLVDDKASSFKGLPEDCGGALIIRGKKKLASQRGEVAARICQIKSLDELDITNL